MRKTNMGGRGTSATRNIFQRANGFDEAIFNKLPKKLQVKNIIDIGKDKTIDGNRYRAVIMFEDGTSRSIGEYSMLEFKYYIEQVLKDKSYQQ